MIMYDANQGVFSFCQQKEGIPINDENTLYITSMRLHCVKKQAQIALSLAMDITKYVRRREERIKERLVCALPSGRRQADGPLPAILPCHTSLACTLRASLHVFWSGQSPLPCQATRSDRILSSRLPHHTLFIRPLLHYMQICAYSTNSNSNLPMTTISPFFAPFLRRALSTPMFRIVRAKR